MQISPPFHNGDIVETRRRRWRIVDIRAFEGCRMLTLTGIGSDGEGRRRILIPFDTVATVDRSRTPRLVGVRRWRRACRALLARSGPPARLRTASAASIDLLPHQLEPAMAIVRGLGSRVLLADDVGLGKTIQAGVIVAELLARGAADRVLVVTPAGLRDQWREELRDRFGIDAAIADAREVRGRVSQLPVGANPWVTMPTAIASIDYLKRPEILQTVLSCRWDVLIVDEAHGLGPDSERHAAIATLAGRTGYVLLLTATPHSGDSRSFESLCAIGARNDALLVFRRTKADVRLGAGRRLHRLEVRPSVPEARMHERLGAFTKAVRSEHEGTDAWIALAVLHKRAFSSARSLELTVARRLAALSSGHDRPRQLALPMADPDGDFDAADQAPDCLTFPGLADERRERRLLGAVLDAARSAASQETKSLALRRLLHRVTEPIVVFTEFRDTLEHLRSLVGLPVAILHGGLSRSDRAAALDDFVSGRRRVLLATDAAGEGLNLHQGCRVVVNLELPWNPIRLEQRIGRVDRIGQRQRVHVFHFIGRDTGEGRVLERLKARIARARADISAANPICDEEAATARFVIDGRCDEPAADGGGRSAEVHIGHRVSVDLTVEAREEAARLARARGLSDGRDAPARADLELTRPWMARTRRWHTRRRLAGRAVAIMRIVYEDANGRECDSTLVPLTFPVRDIARRGPKGLAAFLEAAAMELQTRARQAARGALGEISALASAFSATALSRQQRIVEARTPVSGAPLQAGLFDRRAERAAAATQATDVAVGDGSVRLTEMGGRGVVRPRPAELLLLLAP